MISENEAVTSFGAISEWHSMKQEVLKTGFLNQMVDDRNALKSLKAGNAEVAKHYNFPCREVKRRSKRITLIVKVK